METRKYHLQKDFAVYKTLLKINFGRGIREREKQNEVRTLLNRRTQSYTLNELDSLFVYLWTDHDERVVRSPHSYLPIQVYTANKLIRFGQLVKSSVERLREEEIKR